MLFESMQVHKSIKRLVITSSEKNYGSIVQPLTFKVCVWIMSHDMIWARTACIWGWIDAAAHHDSLYLTLKSCVIKKQTNNNKNNSWSKFKPHPMSLSCSSPAQDCKHLWYDSVLEQDPWPRSQTFRVTHRFRCWFLRHGAVLLCNLEKLMDSRKANLIRNVAL